MGHLENRYTIPSIKNKRQEQSNMSLSANGNINYQDKAENKKYL